MPDVAGHPPALDYADVAWSDTSPLAEYGRDPAALTVRLRAMLMGEAAEDEDLVAWLRRDIAPRTHDAEEVYARLATGGPGERIFASGTDALAATGYAGLAAGVDRWAAERFAGLGCPWSTGTPGRGETVADLGCGSAVDVAIAVRAVGPTGAVVGVDCRPDLMPSTSTAPPRARFVLAPAEATTLPDAWATMIVANGLPPLLDPRSAPAVLGEMRRILAPSGEVRAVVLVTGPDVAADDLDEVTIVNAVRCGKPPCARFRRLLADTGFVDAALTRLPTPFASGFRPGPVAAVLLTASRPS